MKAMIVSTLGDADVLRQEDRAIPQPGTGQVLIRVKAASVNFADIKARQGEYHGASHPPFIPGLDAVGTIEAVGSDVSDLSTGVRVAAFPEGGSYAEWVVADRRLVYPLPGAMDWETAAALPTVAFTSYMLLARVGQIEPSETVLVHAAAGGVGTTAIQMARLLGASRIFGTVSRPEKRSIVDSLGAEATEYEDGGFHRYVNDRTQGRGVDVILDSIGGSVSEDSLKCLAKFGRLVHFGSASGQPGSIRVSDLHATCRSVRGFSLGTVRMTKPDMIRPAARTVFDWVSEGKLTMQIGRHYPLSEAAAAHRWMESRQSIGKIILDVDA